MSREQEIRERLEAATPGPWRVLEDDWAGYAVADTSGGIGTAYIASEIQQGYDEGKNDADLIASAPADLAYLLAENARLRAQLDTVRELADKPHRAEAVYEIRAALNQGGETNGE